MLFGDGEEWGVGGCEGVEGVLGNFVCHFASISCYEGAMYVGDLSLHEMWFILVGIL